MISVKGLCVAYGRRAALTDVNIEISRGEMVGLLGPNGSGKTTLVKALTGVTPIASGEIRLGGDLLETLAPGQRARRVAAVPQRQEGANALLVRTLVLMGRYPYLSFFGGYSQRDEDIAFAAMRETGVAPFADRAAGELSGGEFQRVLIARALAQEADALLLDEASSGLDPARKIEIHDLLAARNEQGLTVVSAIHDLNLAAQYCRRLIILKEGRVAKDGPVEDIFTENNLSEIYETAFTIFRHPATGALQCLPVPGGVFPPRERGKS